MYLEVHELHEVHSKYSSYTREVHLVSISGQLLLCTEKGFQGGFVFKARRLFVSLISRPRVIKKKKTLDFR